MMTIEEKLRDLGIELPEPAAPLGSYVPALTTGNLVFISGILPMLDGGLFRSGKVDSEVSLAEAQQCAKYTAINALAILKTQTGTLDRVRRCIKLTGYIASSSDFFEQPKVLNAASDLLSALFGQSGRHVRSAVGVNVLPLNAPVEIEFLFETT